MKTVLRVGEIMKCNEYNSRCTETISMFLTPQGNYRNYGWVGKPKEHTVIWRKTRKEILTVLMGGK